MRPSELTFLNHHIVYLPSSLTVRVVEARTMFLCSLFILIFYSVNILFLDANARCPSGTYKSSIGDCLPIGESPNNSIMSPIQSMLDASNSIVNQLTSSINHCNDRVKSGDVSLVDKCDKIFLSFGQHMKSFFVNYRQNITSILYPKTILIPMRDFNPSDATANVTQAGVDVQDLVLGIEQLSELVKRCSNVQTSESTLVSNCTSMMSGMRDELDTFKTQNLNDINSLEASSFLEVQSNEEPALNFYPSESKETSLPVNSTTGMQLLEDSKLGLKFEIPSKWGDLLRLESIEPGQPTSISFAIWGKDDSGNAHLVGINVAVYDKKTFSLQGMCRCNTLKDFMAWHYKQNYDPSVTFINDNQTTIGRNYPAWQTESVYFNEKLKSQGFHKDTWISVFAINNDAAYMFRYSSERFENFDAFPDFKKVLDSVQFIPHEEPKKPSFLSSDEMNNLSAATKLKGKEWKTYTSDKCKISFPYPFDSTLREKGPFDSNVTGEIVMYYGTTQFVLYGCKRIDDSIATPSINMQIWGETFENSAKNVGSTFVEHTHVEKGLIDGEDAGVFSVLEDQGSLKAEAYVTVHNRITYTLSFRGLADSFDSPEEVALRQKILHSLKFTSNPQYLTKQEALSSSENNEQISNEVGIQEETVKILSTNSFIDSLGYYHVVGEVKNDRLDLAKFVKVIGTFYDSIDKVVGTGFTYTHPNDIPSGHAAPFELILLSASIPISKIDHYKLEVSYQ